VAWYLCAMGDIYSQTVSSQGYAAAVRAIAAANPRPRPQEGIVPCDAEPLLDEFAAYGSPAQVRARLALGDDAVDIATVALPPGLAWQTLEATLRAGAPVI
jgi:hypothetical protein